MIFLTAFALILGFFCQWFFFKISYFSWEIHRTCIELSPSGEFENFYQNIVCGSSLTPSGEIQQLKTLGLIHLMVVSGAHLIFFLEMLKLFLPTNLYQWLRIPLSFFMVLVCNLHAPIVRAWVYFCFRDLNGRLKLMVPSESLLILSVTVTLLSEPSLAESPSLILSWLASLAIQQSRNLFIQSLLVYLFLMPLMLSFFPLSIWSVLSNTLLAPAVGLLLFPFSLLSFALPWMSLLTDEIWRLFFRSVQTLSFALPQLRPAELSFSLTSLWLYAFTLHFFVSLARKRIPT